MFTHLPRPRVGSITLSVLTSAYVLLFLNLTFWRKSVDYYAQSAPEGVAFAVTLAALFVAFPVSISVKYLLKPVLVSAILVSASAAYFIDNYGISFTRDMIENVVSTTTSEARQFFTVDLLIHLGVFGLAPSALIAWVQVRHDDIGRKVIGNSLVALPCLALAGALVMINYPGFASTFRERGDILESINPAAPVVAAVKFGYVTWRDHDVVMRPLGTDARKGDLISGARKPVLTIIVAGETARAQNFSLNGYARETNPELGRAGVINYPHATSCGTATAVSLPCMFSVYSREDYSDRKSRSTENLMNVLSHAGVEVEWWDNNTGSKGIAALIHHTDLFRSEHSALCGNNECLDQILIERLKPYLDTIDKDTVLVLHQLGSHGPSYHLRYPASFARFKPDCQSAHFSDCSHDEIVNAYDNTILYTDHFLGQVVDLLKQHQDRLVPAMIYMSDHGESLGEGGLYLHGAPYMFAPEAQTHIPFMLWLSEEFAAALQVDPKCLRARAGEAVSHDNLFHTVLGMMDIRTSVHQPDLDLMAACPARPAEVSSFQN